MPWSGSNIFLSKEINERERVDVEVSPELRAAACVYDHEEAIRVMNVCYFSSDSELLTFFHPKIYHL